MKPSPRFGWNLLFFVFVGLILCLCAGTKAYANSVTINFGSLAEGASTSAIATYIDNALATAGCKGCTVTVVGAVGDRTWDGDGHVVGPSGHPLTLGTYSGSPSAISNAASPTGWLGTSNNLLKGTASTFLADTTDGGTQIGKGAQNEMYFTFAGFKINGTVSFDYEIFPCGVGACTPPGFTFEAGTGKSGSDPSVFTNAGVKPSGTIVQSPDSSKETSEQLIAYYSTTLTNDTELDFLDWPATIGINNLTLSWTPPAKTPEPGTMILVGTGLAGLYLKKRKKLANP